MRCRGARWHGGVRVNSRITDGAVNYPEEREARWRRREGGCDVVGPDGTAEYV